MARYNFFSKKGRPTKVEKQICQQIKSLLEESSEVDPYLVEEFCANEGVPSTQQDLETLYAHLTGETPLDTGSSSDIDEDYQEYHNEEETNYSINEQDEYIEPKNMKKGSSDINFDPFNEPVIERAYTKGFVEDEVDEPQEQDIPTEEPQEQDIPTEEPQEQDIPNDNIQDVEFSEEDMDIPEPDYVQNQNIGFSEEDEDGLEDEEYEDEGGALNEGNLEDLSPAQKRKSAEKNGRSIVNDVFKSCACSI